MSSLTDRLRGVIGTAARDRPTDVAPRIADDEDRSGSSDERGIPVVEVERSGDSSRALSCLDGDWRGGCFVVDRTWHADARHGRDAIGTMAERLDTSAHNAALFASGTVRPPFVFFDLETTGLNGGAGTLAFLVGCAWFESHGGFRTRQFLLTKYTDERAVLESVRTELRRAGALVSFNGKSFDAPLLETRYLFHRLGWVGATMPHIDVLHPARQFWKRRTQTGDAILGRSDENGCSLVTLERQVLGSRRNGDVPGFGNPRPLFSVRAERRRAAAGGRARAQPSRSPGRWPRSTSRLLHLTHSGPDEARDGREALALGRVYARAGRDEQACSAFRRAVAVCDRSPSGVSSMLVRVESLRLMAILLRRARRHVEAAGCWRQLLDVRGFRRERAARR